VARTVVGILDIIYKDGRVPTVENVQDLVEKILIEKGHARVAKAFILYREQHRKIREGHNLFDEGIELIENYLDRSDWRVNENSNMSYSLQGLNNPPGSALTAKYWLERIIRPSCVICTTAAICTCMTSGCSRLLRGLGSARSSGVRIRRC
jgi:ribonucleoside-triphosphate reductase